MYKTSLLLVCAFGWNFSSFAEEEISDPEQISYEWLVDSGFKSGYTDHISHFHEIFNTFHVNTFLEFGLGYSTKYFLDSCEKVISVEFVTNGSGPDWIKKCLALYKDYSHWIPITYFSGCQGDTQWAPYKYMGSDHVYNACSYQCASHKDYSLIDSNYLRELDLFITSLTKCYSIGCAFVDPGIYLRGDLVSLLFFKVPIIVAHDTAPRILKQDADVYGYSRIRTPDTYEEIEIPVGTGTTVWVQKQDSFQSLIEALKNYAAQVN